MIETVLKSGNGSVIAPAGCGKTHLLTEILGQSQPAPYLVLTHTTAGVAALKKRLAKLKIPTKNCVITTIDGWCMKFTNSFNNSCPIQSNVDQPGTFYPELRKSVLSYLASGAVNEILISTYSRLLVDEYQDCDFDQHNIICTLSSILPTTVFGDPMQRIFNFRGMRLPNWETEVLVNFPVICELATPWRWENSGTHDLGSWLLESRTQLARGDKIDLTTCPDYIYWKPLTGNDREDHQQQVDSQYEIRKNNNDSLLIIGNPYRAESRHSFASSVNGVDVVETVDLRDVVYLANVLDNFNGQACLDQFLTVLTTMMSGTEKAKLKQRAESIVNGRNRTPATAIELAYIKMCDSFNPEAANSLVLALEESGNTRVFRTSAFSAVKEVLQLKVSNPAYTFLQSAEVVREARRHNGENRVPYRAIGSTLLLKGLEADHVLIQNADDMNSQNLYVALSRGVKSITVFSQSPLVG
ncbi:UvrD-helicase domain-containing protein [Thalassotalea sp. SU-HH00458]|uniref:UvrD-helicase domain-containing protein n=1 Tax=Thalassotalea sp. SU-HH00458 TaxID=3127657 RepID=UPI003104662A